MSQTEIQPIQIASSNTPQGSVLVTPPGANKPIFAAPGPGISISPQGQLNATVGPQGPAGVQGAVGPAGPQGPPGTTPTLPAWKTELLTGTIDGVNATFTLSAAPLTNSQVIFRNGLALFSGAGDFMISGNTVTFQAGQIPQPGDILVAQYQH